MRELVLALLLAGDVLFPALHEGRRLGTLRIEPGTHDARGTRIEPGTYALHYVRQPPLKDHLDTAEHPDFAVLLPERASREAMTVAEVVRAARTATGAHPWVLALAPPGTDGTRRVGEVGVRLPGLASGDAGR
jgi:hypothetical protein